MTLKATTLDEHGRRSARQQQGTRKRSTWKRNRASRDRYGRHRFGQSVLLARRLVEAGVSLVQVNWTRIKDGNNDSPMWDTHPSTRLAQDRLMPPMDAASRPDRRPADRGLLDETLVVWMGEFGRTPKINGNGGRDHWGNVFSLALAGGGVRGGRRAR